MARGYARPPQLRTSDVVYKFASHGVKSARAEVRDYDSAVFQAQDFSLRRQFPRIRPRAKVPRLRSFSNGINFANGT